MVVVHLCVWFCIGKGLEQKASPPTQYCSLYAYIKGEKKEVLG